MDNNSIEDIMQKILNCNLNEQKLITDENTDENIDEIIDEIIDYDVINIENYEIDTEENQLSLLNLLNIYTCYFKQVYEKNRDTTMFENINTDDINSTNQCLELLYEEINKFKNSQDENKNYLYDPNDDILDPEKELYTLCINNESIYVQYIF